MRGAKAEIAGGSPQVQGPVEPLALPRAESRDACSAAAAPPKQEMRDSPEPVGSTRQTEESQAKHAISSDREADYLHSCQSTLSLSHPRLGGAAHLPSVSAFLGRERRAGLTFRATSAFRC